MGSYVGGVYVPVLGEEGWDDEVGDFLTRSGEALINVKAEPFAAVGNGVIDDTAAIQLAIDYVVARAGVNGPSIYFPPGRYKVTSTFDLTGLNTAFHFVGGNNAGGLGSGQTPPGVVITGAAMTDPIFYYNGHGSVANHTYENLSIVGGRTAVKYFDAAQIAFKNCSLAVSLDDGNADNAALVHDGTFLGYYDRCAFTAPSSRTDPSVILRGVASAVNKKTSDYHRFTNCWFEKGGVQVQQNTDPPSGGNLVFISSITENAQTPFLEFIESGPTTTYHFYNVVLIACENADAGANKPLVHVNATHLELDSPVLLGGSTSGNIGIKLSAGSVTGARTTANRFANRIWDATEATTAGNYISEKEWGFDIIAQESVNATSTSHLTNSGGPALRLAITGEAQSGVGLAASSARGLMFGAGGSTSGYDTNLYRRAADQLKTDDKLLAAAGLGVGNAASATESIGKAVVKKIEVFDASGVSLGFIPVYSSIT